MLAFSRKWTFPFGILLILTVAYIFVARHEPRRTAIEKLEAVVAPYELKYSAETNVQNYLVVSANQREILVQPSWVRVELKKAGGTSISGITAWNVSVLGRNVGLQAALLNALNESPATAQKLVAHPDGRVQFLLLMVLSDWGHGLNSVADPQNRRNDKLWNLKPYAIEALLALAYRNDPHAVGTVISALQCKGQFSTDVFLTAMAHSSSEIRAQALRWLNPEQQQLTSVEIQAVAPVLIDHLTDRDLVVRQWSLICLQSLVAYWEQRLGGAPINVVRTHQEKMIKLPIAPASYRWYRDVLPQSAKFAQQYQAEWQAWLTKASQSL